MTTTVLMKFGAKCHKNGTNKRLLLVMPKSPETCHNFCHLSPSHSHLLLSSLTFLEKDFFFFFLAMTQILRLPRFLCASQPRTKRQPTISCTRWLKNISVADGFDSRFHFDMTEVLLHSLSCCLGIFLVIIHKLSMMCSRMRCLSILSSLYCEDSKSSSPVLC